MLPLSARLGLAFWAMKVPKTAAAASGIAIYGMSPRPMKQAAQVWPEAVFSPEREADLMRGISAIGALTLPGKTSGGIKRAAERPHRYSDYSNGAKCQPSTNFSRRAKRTQPTGLKGEPKPQFQVLLWASEHSRSASTLVYPSARPNVRVEAGPTARRQPRAGENAPCATGPGLVACRWASPRTRG